MKISSLLLKPHIAELERQFNDLAAELKDFQMPDKAGLKDFVDNGLQELHDLELAVSSVDEKSQAVIPTDLYDSFRRIKLELRVACRRWTRYRSTERRNQSKGGTHVSTAAA